MPIMTATWEAEIGGLQYKVSLSKKARLHLKEQVR
jgi:hypothetical protein